MLFTAVLLVAGCSDNQPNEPESLTGQLDLNSDFGGYTTSNENYAFDEPLLIEETSDDIGYNDPMTAHPIFDSLMQDTIAGKYHIRMVWGKLRYDSSVTEATSWDGSLETNVGALAIKRIIHWELNQDYILERTDRKLIEWLSTTTVHNDGLAVDLFVPPVRSIIDTSYSWVVDSLGDSSEVIIVDTTNPMVDPVEVTFTTAPYTRTFTLDELNKLDTIIYLDDSNAVAFHAFKADRRACPAGFVNGFWGYDDDGQGRFRGLWVDTENKVIGYVSGHFGVNDEGENVLFGKYINRNGIFEGFIKGTYEVNQSDSARGNGGIIRAEIVNQNRVVIGALEGKFRAGERWQNGFFAGRWKVRCGERPLAGDDSESDGF